MTTSNLWEVKNTEEDIKNRKDLPCSQIKKIYILTEFILSKISFY